MDASIIDDDHNENDDNLPTTIGGSWNDEIAAVVAAAVAGARYGVKIRLPHALIMTFMFRRDLSIHDKLRVVTRAVLEHARSLGSFALVYKACLLLLKVLGNYGRQQIQTKPVSGGQHQQTKTMFNVIGRVIMSLIVPSYTNNDNTTMTKSRIPRAGRPAQNIHALVAGAVGGYLIWGQWSAVSHQVLMYISIRVLSALWKLLPMHDPATWRTDHRFVSTMAWAAVMYLWETHPELLQSSMRKSMNEIYDSFPGILNGIPLLQWRTTSNQHNESISL